MAKDLAPAHSAISSPFTPSWAPTLPLFLQHHELLLASGPVSMWSPLPHTLFLTLHILTHIFIQQLSIIAPRHSMPATVLGSWDTAVNKTDRKHGPHGT